MEQWIMEVWQATLKQQAEQMCVYFHPDAIIRWHNTNEQFTLSEYIDANCKYPGTWDGEVERIEPVSDGLLTITHVYGEGISFHVTSFFTLKKGKIQTLDEYWSEDGEAPAWRQAMHIGKTIQ